MAASLALQLRLAPSSSAPLSLHRRRRGAGILTCRATATFHQLDAVGEFSGGLCFLRLAISL